MITENAIVGYIRERLPDAAVTVVDRTGTMDHFLVRVVSAGFAGKNLLDRNRIVYQALDGPLKDGRIHALEIKALAPNEP
jgi:stress-induced morphogen